LYRRILGRHRLVNHPRGFISLGIDLIHPRISLSLVDTLRHAQMLFSTPLTAHRHSVIRTLEGCNKDKGTHPITQDVRGSFAPPRFPELESEFSFRARKHEIPHWDEGKEGTMKLAILGAHALNCCLWNGEERDSAWITRHVVPEYELSSRIPQRSFIVTVSV